MAGDIQLRQTMNEGIAETMINIMTPLMLNTAMVIFYLFVMLRYSVLLTVIGLVSIGLNLIVAGVLSAKRINITRCQARDEGLKAATTVSGIQMIESIKSAGSENSYFRKWAGYQASVNAQKVRLVRWNAGLGSLMQLLASVANGAVLVLGVWLAMYGKFTLGMILSFQGFLLGFMNPAMMLVRAGQSMQEMRTNMERIQDVMDYPEDPVFSEHDESDNDTETKYEKLHGDIELKNVTFGYSPLDTPIIKDFSIHIKRGSSVALVGSSGCGKSTVVKLIGRLLEPWSGEILFDGKPAGTIDRTVFTGSVAVVDQEFALFEDTIADNIRLWDRTIEDFEMILAARDAQIYDTIVMREQGFYDPLIEGGRNLSGGQRQRIEIARALAQEPTVLIMDEATSALDARTEQEVMKAVRLRGITCILVAHRLSTIRDCDEIIVMDEGKIVERGTHQELYEAGGLYKELVSDA
jgi:ABC-type bacteriocin/lantibiotic exporter with double-glycine peptidase domain